MKLCFEDGEGFFPPGFGLDLTWRFFFGIRCRGTINAPR
jgi:hypothetical protein